MPWTLSGFADEASESSAEQAKATSRAGFRHVDLRNVDGFNISVLPLDKAQAIRKTLDAAGLTCTMFGSPIGKIDIADDFNIDLDRLRHLAKLRDVLGCNKVRIFSYFNKTGRPMAEWERESMRRLNALRDLAGELGMVLYHENEHLIFGDTVEHVSAIATLRDGNGEDASFRMIFDFDNYNQVDEDVWDAWQKLRHATDAFHLKDSKRDKTHVPMGTGDTHARRILKDAVDAGWTGHVAMEPHLMHSAAVMATGPGGKANEAFADMPGPDMYVAAAGYVKNLLKDVGAKWD